MRNRERPRNRDNIVATMYRIDPQRLKAVRRAMTGVTRCPECDAMNDARRRRCEKCGAKLYPVEEYDETPIFERDKENPHDSDR